MSSKDAWKRNTTQCTFLAILPHPIIFVILSFCWSSIDSFVPFITFINQNKGFIDSDWKIWYRKCVISTNVCLYWSTSRFPGWGRMVNTFRGFWTRPRFVHSHPPQSIFIRLCIWFWHFSVFDRLRHSPR